MTITNNQNEYDVIIIGGGATGCGTARDCAMRGLKVLLVERFDLADGATGRNHGLLHSGARYAVTDQESAKECIKENMILKKIAKHCVEPTNGFFITLPEDDIAYQDKFVKSCLESNIKAEIIDPQLAKRLEPSVNKDIIGAVKVPDGSIDPFRLCTSNIAQAKEFGAKVLIYTEVTKIIKEGTTVIGIEVFDHKTKQSHKFYSKIVVNACGIWGHNIAKLADININMFPAKGSLLIFAHRVNNIVLNRCRKPANADILVPGDTICIIGTTSERVEYDECDKLKVSAEEVDILLNEGAKLAPSLSSTRILRAYAGVRPLVSADNDPSGRNISRGIVLLDHSQRDGLDGFITITGGKLMTYRLMAEQTTDLICNKLNIKAECKTASTPLPGSNLESLESQTKKLWQSANIGQKAAVGRLGSRAANLQLKEEVNKSLVCECEEVSLAEVEDAINNQDIQNMVDLRRRTRVGMGTCQGELCACRAAGLFSKAHSCTQKAKNDMLSFMQERWKGVYPIAWGESLRETEYTRWIYANSPKIK